jgi:hypothetical protein
MVCEVWDVATGERLREPENSPEICKPLASARGEFDSRLRSRGLAYRRARREKLRFVR